MQYNVTIFSCKLHKNFLKTFLLRILIVKLKFSKSQNEILKSKKQLKILKLIFSHYLFGFSTFFNFIINSLLMVY